MKPLYFLLLIPLLLAGCEKNTPSETDDDDVSGLPPVTQTGANTLGFLLNGKPWTPAGPNNLSIDYDPGFNEGIVGIVSYRTINARSENFGIGIRDSLNHYAAPFTKILSHNGLFRIGVYVSQNCFLRSTDSTTFGKGSLFISVLDRRRRIISGTFDVTLYDPQCGDTIHITQGRFDMGF